MSGFKQKWATKIPTGGTTWCLGVFKHLFECPGNSWSMCIVLLSHFCMNYISCICFQFSKQKSPNEGRNKQKTPVVTGLQKRQQKNPKKLVASTLVPNLREVASTLFPKNAACFIPKTGVEVKRFQNPMHYIQWYLGWRSVFLARWPQNHTQYLWLVRRWVTKESTTILGLKKLVYQPQKIFPRLMDSKKARIETLTP